MTSNDTLDHPAKEKLRLDQKLDKALEESFPCSDPISISQPAPDNKPRGPGPVAMVNSAAGCENGPSEALMKVTCPNCSAEAEITGGNKPFGYKIVCPVLRDHLARRCPDKGIDCPHMGPIIRVAALKFDRAKAPLRSR